MKRFWWCLSTVLLGCDPEPVPPPEGVDIPEGACGHALYVVSSDYQSTSVAIVGYDGQVLSSSILSSASESAGLSVPLSGDVTAPTSRTSSGQIVLMDRFPAGVISFLDPTGPEVTRQITVQTGFNANPQDVLELDNRLYISRYELNPDPGAEPFDRGSDVLIADAADGALIGSIPLEAAMEGAPEGFLPRPSRMVAIDGLVYVLLSAYSADFARSDDGRVAVIDPARDEVVRHVALTGARGCSGLAVSPSKARIAVACSGTFAGASTPSIDDSAIVVLAVEEDALTVEQTIFASTLGEDPVNGFSVAFVSEESLLASTFGVLDASGEVARPDRLLEVSLDGAVRELGRSDKKVFTMGDVRCEAACGVCFAADADGLQVQRFAIQDGQLGESKGISLDDGIGLPPRYLGAY